MELNYFIFAGLLLRYLYYWSNNTYTYEYFKTKMLKPVLFSVAVVITLFIVSFYFKFEYTDWWQEPFMALMYVFIGWTPDSVFLALMKLSENKFNKVIENKMVEETTIKAGKVETVKTETATETHTETEEKKEE